MGYDIAMIYANIASSFAVALMLWLIKIQLRQDHRIQRIEGDLYVVEGNPTSLPLTQQVFNLQQDVVIIKETCEKLHLTIESINTTIHDYLPLPRKKKKGGR